VEAHIVAPSSHAEYLDLYQRYLGARHRGGGMDDHGTHEFEQFLIGSWNDGRFLELRQRDTHRLLAVAVSDVLPDALSAVYTFFDPDESARSLGTLGVLKQLEWAKRDARAHLYLGYWIAGHPKMAYKRRFQPLEAFDGRGWASLPA
jgi:arginine-tRNA-protein transferase